MRAPPAGGRPSLVNRCGPAAAARPADNSLALAQPPDITCGQRGKGGGPTACIAVGLARWLSASRRPAGAFAVASARQCDHWSSWARPPGVVCVPQGGGRRIHGRHRAPGLTGLVQPVPVWPASHPAGARRCARPSGGHAPPRVRGARPHGRRPGVFISAASPISVASRRLPRLPVRQPAALSPVARSWCRAGARPAGLKPRRCA